MLRYATVMSMIVLAVLPGTAPASDVLMSGSFTMDWVAGTPGADLLGILGHENHWSIFLQGVQFVCDDMPCFMPPGSTTKVQNLLATSFTFQFTGPDATILNDAVGQHFTQGGLYPHGAYFQVDKGVCDPFQRFIFYIFPNDTSDGVYMQIDGYEPIGTFPDDMNGCPTIGPFALQAVQVVLFDRRGMNEGNIAALNGGPISLQIPIAVEERSWAAIKAIYR